MRATVIWLNLTLGRNPKTLPSKSLSRETDRRQKLVKTRGCAVGKGNVLREVLCPFLGRNKMSLVRVCCSQQSAWPGRDGAGHAWLSSTLCPVGMCCSAGSISCCCTEPVTGIAASPRQGGARAFLLLSAQPRISQPTSPARHTMKLNSNVLQHPERMELLVSVQPCKVESSRCQVAFYSPDFKAGLVSSTQAPRQLF